MRCIRRFVFKLCSLCIAQSTGIDLFSPIQTTISISIFIPDPEVKLNSNFNETFRLLRRGTLFFPLIFFSSSKNSCGWYIRIHFDACRHAQVERGNNENIQKIGKFTIWWEALEVDFRTQHSDIIMCRPFVHSQNVTRNVRSDTNSCHCVDTVF